MRKGTVLVQCLDVFDLAEYDPDETFGLCQVVVEIVVGETAAANGQAVHIAANTVICAWNVARPCPQHQVAACRTALAINEGLTKDPDQYQSEGHSIISPSPPSCSSKSSLFDKKTELKTSMWSLAMATGNLYQGRIANTFSVFGIAVERACMLTHLCRQMDVTMLGAASTKEACNEFLWRPLDAVEWASTLTADDSRNEATEVVYELCATESLKLGAATQALLWSQAFNDLLSGRNDSAAAKFEGLAMHDVQASRLSELAKTAPERAGGHKRQLQIWERCAGDTFESPISSTLSSIPTSPLTALLNIQGSAFEARQQEEVLHDDLRLAIDKALIPGPEDDADSCVSSNDSRPQEVTDTAGTTWRRSSRLIGKGAFGEVWLGMGGDGSFVAMKFMPLPKAKGGKDAVVNEVKMLSHLRHVSIVSLMGCAVFEGYVVITMEYVPGGTLADVMDNFGALPQATAKRYARAILGGLTYLHSHEIIHCDLKPANILLDTDGSCRLSDFGTSTSLSSVRAAAAAGPRGTIAFMAPESARGQTGMAADIWALGLILLQMVMNSTPFIWDTELAAMNSNQFLRWLASETGAVPLPCVHEAGAATLCFVSKCLCRSPADRETAASLSYNEYIVS